jgi:hypothetical protein
VSVGVHSLTLSCTPGSMKCDSWDSFLARTFASPCFSYEPKVKVATDALNFGFSLSHNLCFKFSNGPCEPILDIYISRAF